MDGLSGTDNGVIMELIDVDIAALTAPQMTFDHFSYYDGTGTAPVPETT